MLEIGQSLLGMLCIFGVGYFFCSDRSRISWRVVGGAFNIQLVIAALVLYVPAGKQALEAVAGVVMLMSMRTFSKTEPLM